MIQGPVGTNLMIIIKEPVQDPMQMSGIQDEELVQALAPECTNQPLHIRILPRTTGRDVQFLHSQSPDALSKNSPVNRIAITQEEPRRGLRPKQSVHRFGLGLLGLALEQEKLVPQGHVFQNQIRPVPSQRSQIQKRPTNQLEHGPRGWWLSRSQSRPYDLDVVFATTGGTTVPLPAQ